MAQREGAGRISPATGEGALQAMLPPGGYTVTPDSGYSGSHAEILEVGKYGKGNTARRPSAAAIKAQVHAMEEKGSDVNLACHLVHDCWAGRFDSAAVVSNDTDLVEPIRIVVRELNRPVTLLCPSSFGASKPLASVATSVRHTHAAHLRASQFPTKLPHTTITKPAGW